MKTRELLRLIAVLTWLCAFAVPSDGFDFGDAPDPPYPTLLASNGAWHSTVAGISLGTSVDNEADGQPNATATGDDFDGNDDDDGVVFASVVATCEAAIIDVVASAAGILDAWVDYNADGDWADPGEQIFTGEPLIIGSNVLSFVVPCTATPTNLTYARFRFSSSGGLSFVGPAADGEARMSNGPVRGGQW